MSDDKPHYYFLLASGRTIEKILHPKTVKEFKAYDFGSSKKDTYNQYAVYQWSSKDHHEKCPVKVGDMVPASALESNLLLVKRKGPLKERVYQKTSLVDDQTLKNQFKFYMDELTQEKIDQAKELLKDLNDDDELAYRALYHSFKMYRARGYVISMARELLNFIGHPMEKEHPYLVLDQMKLLGFDYKLVAALEKTIETQFELHRNEPDAWMEDLTILLSSFYIFNKSLGFFIRFSEDLLNQRGLFFKENSYLDWFEAGSMEIWEPLGRLRSHMKECKELAEYLKSKNQKSK
jgi:hypothetical protein